MNINKERLWGHLMELKEVGKQGDGSITRLPFTVEDKQAQDKIYEWMQEAGLEVNVDYVGNVIGTLKGSDENLPSIMCGSHYDTVRHGGAFDGCLGVLAGIEALQIFTENNIQPTRTVQVIGFKDEEGNRFGYGMVGSKSICGCFEKEGFRSKDENEVCLYDAMKEYGLEPAKYNECQLTPHIFLEVHIEQAKLLEDKEKPLGIVQGIAGLARYTIKIQGECAHAGATPMAYRQDPVVAMSDWILYATKLTSRYQGMVATIGSILTEPGSCNVICEQVTFSLDIRSLYDEDRKQAIHKIINYQKELQIKYGVQIELKEEQSISSCLCDKLLQEEMEEICVKNDIPYEKLISGAGHDCMNFKEVCKTGMIFVRSQKGYSHRKEEFSSKEDCAKGTQVLYEMLLKHI